MTLIVEDGTGLPNAESYVSTDDADTYNANRGNTLWATITTEEKEQCLRRATEYITGEYRLRWKGRRVLFTQALDWPRVGVVLDDFGGSQGRNNFGSYYQFQVPYNIVPVEIKSACCELAFRAAFDDLTPDLGPRIKSETIGPIKTTYADYSPQYTVFRQIDMLVKVYLEAGGSGVMTSMIRC